MLDDPHPDRVWVRQAMQQLSPAAGPTNDFLDATAARYLQVGEVQTPDGSIVFDNEWRSRIECAGYPKDISNWRILILHRVP